MWISEGFFKIQGVPRGNRQALECKLRKLKESFVKLQSRRIEKRSMTSKKGVLKWNVKVDVFSKKLYMFRLLVFFKWQVRNSW